MTTITATVNDVTGRPDNSYWLFSSALRESNGAGSPIVTEKSVSVTPVAGVLSVELEPGFAKVTPPRSAVAFVVTVPSTDADLWELLRYATAVPPSTSVEKLEAAVESFVENNPGYPWSGIAGKPAGLYSKPGSGIPSTDLTTAAQTSLGKADSAVQPAAMTTAITSAVNGLLNGAPGALDTLKELADALNDDAAFATTVTNALAAKAQGLVPTAVKSAAYTAAAADFVPVDTTTAPVVITLPSAPPDKTRIGGKVILGTVVNGGLANAASFAASGSDVFNKSGGSTTLPVETLNQGFTLQYKASTGIWYVHAVDLSVPQLDARFANLVAVKAGQPWWDSVFAAPTETPTVTSATSSQISGGTVLTPTADYNYDPYFRYDGCSSVLSDAGGAYAGGFAEGEVLVPEIITDASDIEVAFTSGRTGTSIVGLRVVVDGKLGTLQMQRFDSTNTTTYWYKTHFTTSKVRHLKFENNGFYRFKQAVVGTNTVLQRPKGAAKMRHTAIGDSLTVGGPDYHIGAEVSGDIFYFNFESHSYFQSRLMGCDSYINLGVGGTGWSDNVPADPFSNRINLALAGYPHILGFYGSRNDTGKESQVLPAVRSALDRVQDVPYVLVCGPQQAGFSTLNDLVRQGVVAAGRKWLNLDGVIPAPSANVTGHPTQQNQIDTAKAAHAQIDMTKILAVVDGANAAVQPVLVTVATSPASPVHTGASVAITATVVGQVTSGTVQFYDNGVALGSPVTVTSGSAAMTTSALSVATHSLTARFLPTNPRITKPATSLATNLVVDANLGVSESFNRADSTSLGNSDNGKPWSVTGTHWAIASNKLANTSPGSGEFAFIDPGIVVGTYDWTLAGTVSIAPRLMMFFTDASNYAFINANGGSNNWRLWSRTTAGGSVALATGSTSPNWVAGDIIRCIVAQGSTSAKFNFIIRKSSDGGTTWTADIINVTDVDMGTLATSRKAGMYLDTAAPSVTFDAFNMTA